MNLTDLQIELRNIEEYISRLQSEVEKMKPQTEKEKKEDFETITRLARKHPISSLSISNAPQILQKEFVDSLSYLLLSEEKDKYSRLLYLCRLANGCNLNLSAEQIYQNGLAYGIDDLERSIKELQDYKDTMLIEAFVLASLSENTSHNMLSIIADIAKMMGCDKEEIRVLALVAKAKLTDDINIINSMPVPSKSMWCGKLGDYISSDWVMKQRIKCVSVCVEKNTKKSTSSSGGIYGGIFAAALASSLGEEDIPKYDKKRTCVIKNQKVNGSIVKKGEMIVEYEEEVKVKKEKTTSSASSFGFAAMIAASSAVEPETKMEKRTVNAPCNGVVYYKEISQKGDVAEAPDKYLEVYVVSYFDDFK